MIVLAWIILGILAAMVLGAIVGALSGGDSMWMGLIRLAILSTFLYIVGWAIVTVVQS